MSPRLRRADSPADFFERSWNFLVADEAEHNLLLGLAPGLLSGDHDFDRPIHLATVEEGGEVVGYLFRTPPFKVGISRLPPELIQPAIDDLADRYDTIPAVLGPEESAVALAEAWAVRAGGRAEVRQRLRIHAAERIRPDFHTGFAPPRGRLRSAEGGDRELLAEWIEAFILEAEVAGGDPLRMADRMIAAGAVWIWDDGGRVSMVGATGSTPNGIRIGYVYTPPVSRGRGYATAAVAALTEHLFATGRSVVFLYTDLANPVSNGIYNRIGYEPVTEVVDVEVIPGVGG